MSYGTNVAQEAHDLLVALARIPAPSHEELDRAWFIREWLITQGVHARVDNALNVICTCATAQFDELAVFAAHTDVVFPDRKVLPLSEKDGRIWAPGVGDDTASLVCLLLAYRELVRRIENGSLAPRRGIVMAANSCEEGLGNLDGIKALFSRIANRTSTFISLDCYAPFIVTEPVGSHRWRLVCTTPGGHSYSNFGSPNAIQQMSEFIGDFYALRRPDEKLVTVNVGHIEGGTTVNSIAQRSEALIEYRSTSEECLETMRGRLEELVARRTAGSIRFELELLGIRPGMGPVPADAQERLVATCEDAVKATIGSAPRRNSGSTDSNVPLSLGIPAATVGVIRGGGAHTREEWVEVSSLAPGVDCALELMERIVCA